MQRSASFCSHACCHSQHMLVEGALCWITVVMASGMWVMAPLPLLSLGSHSQSKTQGQGDRLRRACEKQHAKVGLEG